MKNLLLILLFVSTILNAQALQLIYGGETPKWAIDLDGSTEYVYKNTPTGLDLNGSELITATADRDFSGAGHWDGVTVSGSVGTFTATASLTNSNFTHFVSGHNYTIQADMKSGASSSFKIVTDNDSTTLTTTTSSVTKAFTFTYSGGSQTVQFKGVGSDTWTGDNISITEAFDLEINGFAKNNNTAGAQMLYFLGTDSDNRFSVFVNSNTFQVRLVNNANIYSSSVAFTNINWYKHRLLYNHKDNTAILYLDDVYKSTISNIRVWNIKTFGKLYIGAYHDSSLKFNGQVGEIKFIRKDGTGAVISTSIYDWKGTSATFLNDKGTNGNNLTGVNVTTADQVKFSGGKYK